MNAINRNNFSIFEDYRISYDTLRYPHNLTLNSSVRQFNPPITVFAHNYISSDNECIIRMSNLQSYPWVGIYVNPQNTVILNTDEPILPIEQVDWLYVKFDFVQVDYNLTNQYTLLFSDNRASKTKFINMRDLDMPIDNNKALNFDPDDEGYKERFSNIKDAFCSKNLNLKLTVNTARDFLRDERTTKKNIAHTSKLLKRLNRDMDEEATAVRPEKVDDFYKFLNSSDPFYTLRNQITSAPTATTSNTENVTGTKRKKSTVEKPKKEKKDINGKVKSSKNKKNIFSTILKKKSSDKTGGSSSKGDGQSNDGTIINIERIDQSPARIDPLLPLNSLNNEENLFFPLPETAPTEDNLDVDEFLRRQNMDLMDGPNF